MDAQQFLAEFGHLANAPGGVSQLRQLILGLAIRGTLLPPSNYTSDASALLHEITKYRDDLVGTGKLRRQMPQPPVEESEFAFSIPEGWAFERLGNICEIVRGVTFPASKKRVRQMPGTVACLRTSNIQAEIEWNDLIYIDSDLVGREDQWLHTGDTMISMANSYELVGKVALVKSAPQQTTFGGFIAAVRPHILEPDYLYLLLRSPYMQARMRATASQTTNIANISLGGMRPIAVPIPPKEVQPRLVAKVDELMVLCDQLEQQQHDRRKLQNALRHSTLQSVASAKSPDELQVGWDRLQSSFDHLFRDSKDVDQLRSMLIELAIRGVLSPVQDQKPGSDATDLTIQQAMQRPGKRFAKVTAVNPPFDLPSTWIWVLLDQLLEESGSGWSPKCDAEPRRPGEWGVLKVSAVTWGEFRAEENKRLPSSFDPRPEYEVKAGDFLLSRANTAELVARSVIVPSEVPDRLLMSDKIVRLGFVDNELKPWTNLVNSSLFAREYYRSNATGTSDSMRNVSRQVIHELPIPLPPKNVQKAVMQRLAELNSLCDNLERGLRDKALYSLRFANAAIAVLTGVSIYKDEDTGVKAPKTQLIAPLRLGKAPSAKTEAPLARELARHNGEMSANDLWQRFGGEIDAFYAQLKHEVAQGWIQEPTQADVQVVEA